MILCSNVFTMVMLMCLVFHNKKFNTVITTHCGNVVDGRANNTDRVAYIFAGGASVTEEEVGVEETGARESPQARLGRTHGKADEGEDAEDGVEAEEEAAAALTTGLRDGYHESMRARNS